MATTTGPFVDRLEDLRVVAPSVDLVVLFGSVARGRSRPDSDLDVAVRCDGPADLDAVYLLLAPRLATSLVDLVDLRRTGSLLDDAKVLASIGARLSQYPSYVQAVESHLTKAGA